MEGTKSRSLVVYFVLFQARGAKLYLTYPAVWSSSGMDDVSNMGDFPKRQVIVVVEDNPAIAELIRDTLNAEPDYQAAVVHDGAMAVEAIRSVQASLVLLDINLPGLSGLEIYDIIQADEKTRSIPVIFVTASGDQNEFSKRGIDDYIAKPFTLEELLTRVAGVCRPGPDQT